MTGGPTDKPLIEAVEPRPAPSELERQNLIRRPDDDRESVADLIKNVQGNDAAIEVIVGRSRLITLEKPLAAPGDQNTPIVAVGDPTVLEFDVLPNGQMIRILGRKVGFTDLSVVTAEGKSYSFEIRVVYDLNLLRAYLKQLFPNANLKLVQMYEHIVVEGQASSVDQTQKIIETIKNYLTSVQTGREVRSSTQASPGGASSGAGSEGDGRSSPDEGEGDAAAEDEPRVEGGIQDKPDVTASIAPPQIINLIRVPGVQQVMLRVKVAEVNRTALREMGTSLLYRDSSGRSFGSQFGSAPPLVGDGGNLLGLALGSAATSFAILPNTSLDIVLDALRSNQVVNVLAEPNLVAMHGQKASFLAGGEFPVPVPQNIGTGSNTITVEFKEFGVLLNFVPYIMDNGAIRLKVAPEVSTIDDTIGVVSSGISIPGVNTRRANTTVELRQGQSLALAGLLQVELDAKTDRLPGLGDVPYLGPFFSNNSHNRVEKELIILVTPYFVDPMEAHQVGPLPGSEIRDPDDYEFYALNRIESRHPGVNYRATNGWDDPLGVRHTKRRPRNLRVIGPYGFSK